MIGFILAAGFGTRLKPLTDHIPKALVGVCGISLLERNLEFFFSQGITKLCVNAHYHADQIYSFQRNSVIPFEVFHEKDFIRGTGGALWFAREFLRTDEAFCVANVDILTTLDLKRVMEVFLHSGTVCMLLATPAGGKGTIGFIPETKEYCGVIDEIDTSKSFRTADFIGIALYRNKVLDIISERDFSIIPVWKRIQEHGYSVTVLMEDTLFWTDVGTPAELAGVHFKVLDGRLKMSLPSTLRLDTTKRTALPVSFESGSMPACLHYAWVESMSVDPAAGIDHSIIYAGAVVNKDDRISNTILTRWGGVPCA